MQFTVPLPKDLRAELEEVAKLEERKAAAVARIAIREYVERRRAVA